MKHSIIRSPNYIGVSLKCVGFDPVSTSASVGSDLISATVNNIFNRSNMKKQQQYNKELLQMQNDFTERMWHETNSYNNPTNVRQRMVNAGLNPIAVGEGVTGSPATSVSSGSPSGVSLPGSTASINNPLMVKAQLDNINADTQQKLQGVELTKSQKKAIDISNDFEESILTTKTTSELAKLSTEYMTSKKQTYIETLYYNSIKDGNEDERLKKAFFAQFDAIVSTAANLVTEGKVLNAQEKETLERAKNYTAQILLGYAGLRNNIQVSQIGAAATKYAADKGYAGVIAGLDRSFEGYMISMLKASGLTTDKVKEVIHTLTSGSSGDVSYDIWSNLGKILFDGK